MLNQIYPTHFIATGTLSIISFFYGVLIGLLIPVAVRYMNKRHEKKMIERMINESEIDITHAASNGIMDEMFDNKSHLF